MKERAQTQGRPQGGRSNRADVYPKYLIWCLVAQLTVATFSVGWRAPYLILPCNVVQFKIMLALPLCPWEELLDIVLLAFFGVYNTMFLGSFRHLYPKLMGFVAFFFPVDVALIWN